MNAETHQKSMTRIQMLILMTSTQNLLTKVKIITFTREIHFLYFFFYKSPPTNSHRLNRAKKFSENIATLDYVILLQFYSKKYVIPA